MNPREGQVGAAAVLGIGIIIAAAIGAYAFWSVHALDNTLAVTGSSTQNVKADAAKWTVTVSRTSSQDGIPSTEARVSNDAQIVVTFFSAAGIAADKITVSPVFADQNYSSDTNAPLTYNVHEDVSIASDNPELVQTLSKQVSTLSAKGVFVSPQAPEYYVTTLPQIRVALIGSAVTDARARAMQIASSTGQRVGALQSASGGVIQVMAPNSVDVSSDGSYDTSTIDKQVMETVHAVFFLK